MTWTEAVTARDALLDDHCGGFWETHAHLICKRCGRVCEPWPLQRAARCAPSDWVQCIAPLEDCAIVVDGQS